MTGVRAWLRALPTHAVTVSCSVAIGLVVLAFASFLSAWAGASRTLSASAQVSYLVSGGLGGLSLLIAGSAFLNAQLGRQAAARERADLDRVLVEARTLLDRLSPAPAEDPLAARARRVG